MNDRNRLFDEWRAQADMRTPPDRFDDWLVAEVVRLRAELAIATKLYAKARRISIDDAEDNIRDARLINSP
jgi:hypothetical protein